MPLKLNSKNKKQKPALHNGSWFCFTEVLFIMKIHFDEICERCGIEAKPFHQNQFAEPFLGHWKSTMPVVFEGGVVVTGEGEDQTSIGAIKSAFEDAVKRYLLRHPPEKVALTGEVLETSR